jgi:DNA-binding response OmpR family regulator
MSNKRVLLVEDDENIAALVKEMFSLYDAEVFHADRGSRALEILEEQPVDFALVDVHLPDTTGDRLYQKIIPRYPHLHKRFIFMSGYELDRAFLHFLKETDNWFIQKPFNLNGFREVVEQFL